MIRNLEKIIREKGDRNLGKKAFGSAPQCFCPHNYSQPHWILYQLLQGGQMCQLAHPKNHVKSLKVFNKCFRMRILSR